MKKILFAGFRSCAFYENRGLADVTGSLPKYLTRRIMT